MKIFIIIFYIIVILNINLINNLNYIDTLQFHEQIQCTNIFLKILKQQIIKNFLKRYKPLLLTSNSELKLEYKSLIKELKSLVIYS